MIKTLPKHVRYIVKALSCVGIMVFVVASSLALQLKPVHAVAADPTQPLCFEGSATAGSSTITVTQAACPTDRNLTNNQCYLVTPGPDSAGRPGLYTPTDCVRLTTTLASDPGAGTDSAALNEWLQKAINLLSALVGIVVTVSLIVAGIQYMTARDNANQVAAAKQRILMSIVSLILFAFAYAILQWLIPGGIFS